MPARSATTSRAWPTAREIWKAFCDTLYQADKSAVPFPDDPPIVYPDAEQWQRLTSRRTREVLARWTWPTAGSAEKKIEEALKSPTQLEFTGTPLRDVIEYLKD